MSLAVKMQGESVPQTSTEVISTQDIFLGAYLLCSGAVLKEIKVVDGRSNKPNALFIFSGENVENLFREFQTGQANANVASFKVTMTNLKDAMFNTLRTGVKR